MSSHSTKSLSVFSLAMLITVSIDSIRNLPATALFGSSLLFFFAAAALCFLFPTALISAELSAAFPNNSGVYQWVKLAFGKHMGFIAIWLQWINTLVWYPTILSFIAGTAVYMINPSIAENKLYLISAILIIFWLLTIINLKGINTSARFASLCSIAGMIIPMLIIIFLAILWLYQGNPAQLHITEHNLIPNLTHGQSWSSLTAIITAFLGIELATVHIKKTAEPKKTFPKAIAISVIIITLTMLLGSLSIAWIIPTDKINLVDGVMQTFSLLFTTYHLQWMIPLITIMLLIGSMGGMINWMISPTKGLLQATEDGYFPKIFLKRNKHDVEVVILVIQAMLVTLICLAFYLSPSINAAYWLLTDLSTEAYLIMYSLLFIAAIGVSVKIKKSHFIPGGPHGTKIISMLGLTGCFIAFIVGFIPPQSIDVGLHYTLTFSYGLMAMVFPAIILIIIKSMKNRSC